MTKVLEYSIKDFEKDHLWTYQYKANLLSAYRDKWVAVRDQHVIDYDDELEKLCQRLKDPGNTYVEYITDEPLEMILYYYSATFASSARMLRFR